MPENAETEAAQPARVSESTVKSRRTPLTLRTKLVLVSVGLAFVVVSVISLVSVLTLKGSLEDRLDAQLASAFNRAVNVLNAPGFQSDSGQSIQQRRGHELNERESEAHDESDEIADDDQLDSGGAETTASGVTITDAQQILNGPAQAPGTLALVLDSGNLTAGYLSENGEIRPISNEQLDGLVELAPDAKPHTLDLGRGLGDYRVQGALVDDNAVIVGLPLRDVRTTVFSLGMTLLTVALLGLAALAALATLIIRRTMRPLERVATAADTVAELDLARGEVAQINRIDTEGVDERTEVGRVATAVNAMIDNVESALVAREQSEQKVRSFVSDASHELRTPLASIRGYSELVRRMGGELPADMQQAIGRIESESVRMTALVEDLLLLARLDEGRGLTLDTVNLTELASQALGDAAVSDATHEWAIEGVDDGDVFVLADRNRLHQVIANLLTNARVHTPAGTDVAVWVGREGEDAVLRVSDNGPGIPAELQHNIFGRFVQADESRTKSEGVGGTGLGLSIAQALMDAHHGSITMTSEPGRTEFVVKLRAVTPVT